MKYGALHHVEYYVDDLPETIRFWRPFLAELEYKEYQAWDEGISFIHQNGTYLVFVNTEKAHKNAKNNRQGAGLNHIAFSGGAKKQVDALAEKVKAQGIRILKRDEHHFYFLDPNEFAVEVFCT